MANRVPAEIFPPGEFLQEELEARGWTHDDLADILGRPRTLVTQIVNAKRRITPETAKGFADAFGTSAELWMNLEAAYQLSQVGDPDDGVARRAKVYAKAPVNQMIRRNWIEEAKNVAVLEKRLCEYLDIGHIDEEPVFFAHAARKSAPYNAVSPPQLVWLIRARKLGSTVTASPYSARRFNKTVSDLRRLFHAVEEVRHVPQVLADGGIRFVILEPLPGSKIDGATFWLDNQSPVIAMSVRYDRIDNFWHTLIHELAHVKNEDGLTNGNPILDNDMYSDDAEAEKPQFEQAADAFAADTLVPKESLDDFIVRISPLYSTIRLMGFANLHGVHPAIVIGQLHHREELRYWQFRPLMEKVRAKITDSALTDGWNHALPAL